MKKRYRFEDPTSRNFLQRARPYVFMFLGWNAIAILSWKYITSKASENDEGFSSRSTAEKVAMLTGSSPTTARVKRITLFGGESEDKSQTKTEDEFDKE